MAIEAYKPAVPATPAHITFWALELHDAALLRVNARRAGIRFKERRDRSGGMFTCKMDDVPRLIANLRDWHKSFTKPGQAPGHASWKEAAECLARDCEEVYQREKENGT